MNDQFKQTRSFDKEHYFCSNSLTVWVLSFCLHLHKVKSHIHVLGTNSSVFSVPFLGGLQSIVPQYSARKKVACPQLTALLTAGIELLPHMRNLSISGSCSRLRLIDYRPYFCHAVSKQPLGLTPAYVVWDSKFMHIFVIILLKSSLHYPPLLRGSEGQSSEYLLVVLPRFCSCQNSAHVSLLIQGWGKGSLHMFTCISKYNQIQFGLHSTDSLQLLNIVNQNVTHGQ